MVPSTGIHVGDARDPEASSTGRMPKRVDESLGSSLMIWRMTSRRFGPLLLMEDRLTIVWSERSRIRLQRPFS